MRYVQVNATATAWAKSIILGKHRKLLEEGHDPYFFWGRRGGEEDERCRRFATDLDNCADALLTRLDGKPGFHSRRATRRLLGWLDEIDPDVVHLHNLLGYYVNVEMLFEWLAGHRCEVVWTLHDCWAFTGHCAYFTYVRCDKWRLGCEGACPQPGTYPETFRRNMEAWNFEQKRRLFTMLPPERMRLITPSQWLADLVKQSFLAKYDVTVVHNTVDRDVFKPTPSDFRERYGIGGRFLVLGVASRWSERKGLGDLVRLAKELDSSYAVVIIGLSPKQIREVRKDVGGSVVALPRTDTPEELAAAYTAADLHVQPSVEETFGMTVAEAQACGTPVVVARGSACEEVADKASIYVTEVGHGFDALKATIVRAGGGCAVIMLERTESRGQLAAIYSAADVFFNPTREDNYPTVNLEAEACGTSVVSCDVGGCAETIAGARSCVVGNFDEALACIAELRLSARYRDAVGSAYCLASVHAGGQSVARVNS